MTDNTTENTDQDVTETILPDAETPEVPEDTEADSGPENGAEEDARKGNPEAAKWRVKFREQETANAALTARVAALQSAQVTSMATGPGKLHDGSDLLAHVDLEHLLDDAGEIDQQKVTDALDDLAKAKPHLMKPAFGGDVGQGNRGQSTAAPSWHDVIAG